MCLLLGTMALLLSRTSRQKVYYQDGQYLVSVRYPGQWNSLLDFVQPNNPDVLAIFSQYGPDPWALYDFVCRHVAYKSDVGEHWQFPSETLARELGDCEDSTFLFVSLAQNSDPDVQAILGDYRGLGHAWGAKNGFIYETTYTEARPVVDALNYRALVAFNHYDIREAYPGALEEALGIEKNESLKLSLMAQALGG